MTETGHIDQLLAAIQADHDAEERHRVRILSAAGWTPDPKPRRRWWRFWQR